MNSVSSGPPTTVGGPPPVSTTSFNPLSPLARVAGRIAGGLCGLFKRMDTQVASFGSMFGQRFPEKAAEGTKIHGYIVVGDKTKGVEPGFIATKDWQPSDVDKLQQPGHAFHTEGCKSLAVLLNTYSGAEHQHLRQSLNNAIDTLLQTGHLPDAQNDMLKAMGDLSGRADLLLCSDKELVKQITQLALSEIVAGSDSLKYAPLYEEIKQHVMNSQAHFTEKHYIKLDYYESNKSLFGKYTIPYAKTKALGGIGFLGKLLHKLGKSSSPRDINQGAVNEKLANDLMGRLGMKTQTLEIVRARYADGTPKVMLDGTHIAGFNDFDGEKKATQGSVYIKDGVLVRNSRLTNDKPGEFNGPPQLHTDIEELGSKKIMMLLIADRDALGSKGGNKGFVGNQFFAIDPGHALEETLLSKRGDVHSDLSFDPASSLASKDYKNFSIFDQSTFAEKMEGVRHLQQLKGQDDALFAEYAAQYGPEHGNDALNFREQLLRTQEQYVGRRNDILHTFSSRLAVDDYQFGEGIDNEPALKKNYRDQTLNLLDGLEKLTSTTVGTAQGKKGGIRLEIPQVLKPADRKAWDVRQNGTNIEFTFVGTPAQAEEMRKTLADFGAQPGNAPLPAVTTDSNGTITVTVPRADILQAQSSLAYDKIRLYKHG